MVNGQLRSIVPIEQSQYPWPVGFEVMDIATSASRLYEWNTIKKANIINDQTIQLQDGTLMQFGVLTQHNIPVRDTTFIP